MSKVTTKSLIDEAMGAKQKEAKPIYTAHFEELIEVVSNDSHAKFLLKDGSALDEYDVDGMVVTPPPVARLGFTLPIYNNIISYYKRHTTGLKKTKGVTDVSIRSGVSAEKVTSKIRCQEDDLLFDRLAHYHRESAELPNDDLYYLITAWDFHTHLLEAFEYSPIIFFAGLPEKGKSRMAKSMTTVCKRGVIRASLTDAQLIREASDHQATLFFDMTDFAKTMERTGSMDIILSRYERGLKVGRVLNPEKGAFQDMVYFDVFGPTIIGSNETIDTILGSRAITIVMRQSKKKFDKNVDVKKGEDLRDQLIAWKLAHFADGLPANVPKIGNGRLGDILQPLHQIIRMVKPKIEEQFINLIKEIEKQRNISKADSSEAEIILAILNLEEKIEHGILPVKEITDYLNENKSDREKLTYQKVGRR